VPLNNVVLVNDPSGSISRRVSIAMSLMADVLKSGEREWIKRRQVAKTVSAIITFAVGFMLSSSLPEGTCGSCALEPLINEL
jgi:hypothetical protein